MAKFRNVSVKFWSDPFVETLTPEQKYFFLYLITNEHTTQCGIYEISYRQMAFETGYNIDTISKLMDYFISKGKIKYSESTKELAIKNFVKHNPQGSPKVKKFVEKELESVKDRVLIGYIYGMDTVSQEEEEEEEEEKQEEEQEEGIIDPFGIGGLDLWKAWIQYKKEEHRQKYKSKKTEQAAIQNLYELSNGNLNTAKKIIEQSIANQYKGLFPIKNSKNGTTKTEQLAADVQEAFNRRFG